MKGQTIKARTRASRPRAAAREKRPARPKSAWANAVPSAAEGAELKKASIIREAAKAFNRGGFHGTSMDDIASHLGVTKAALYRYVRTKHEVLFHCFTLGLDSGDAHLDRAEREGENGLEKLRIALRGYLEDMIGKLGHPSALLEENALLPEHLRIVVRRRDRAEQRFRAFVMDGIADESVIPCDPKLAVFGLLGAISWVPKWYRDGGAWTAEQTAASLVDLMIRSIAADPRHRG